MIFVYFFFLNYTQAKVFNIIGRMKGEKRNKIYYLQQDNG